MSTTAFRTRGGGDERGGDVLAFPARFTSGRPALAVTQPFFSAYAVRTSIAVQMGSAVPVEVAVAAEAGPGAALAARMPSRHVRLSSAGGCASEGWVSPRTFSRGRSCAAR